MSAIAINNKPSRLEMKISIPKYTLGEELTNAITHGIGAVLGIVGLVLCLIRSYSQGYTPAIVSSWIFGMSMIILYTMSCLYHALKPCNAKRVFRIFDHCTIFILIAGTYTPFTLVALKGDAGVKMFIFIWAAAVLGIVLNAIDMERFTKLSMACYLGMGWAIVVEFNDLVKAVPYTGIKYLFLGGIAYTVGAAIFGIGSKVKYMHSLWHLFVMAGTILHFICIYNYVLV